MFEIFSWLANLVVFDLLGLASGSKAAHALHFFVEDTAKIFFLLAAMMLLVGFLRSWISPEKVRHWLEGRSKIIGYGLAVMLGAVTPFCSCSSIPLFVGFLSSGIPLGVTMAFLITSPMVNEVAAVLFGEAIGWPFTLAYVGAGMAVGLIGGVVIDGLKLEKWVEPFVFEVKAGTAEILDRNQSLKERARYAWDEMAEVLGRVWIYVLIGVGIGAAIHGYVPQQWFIDHAGADNPLAVPLAVVLAVPLYSNVTGTIPVAEVLIDKGLPVGTTLAFIMSTVAISLPELVILRKVLRVQMLVFFVLYLAVAFVAVGYGFNAVF